MANLLKRSSCWLDLFQHHFLLATLYYHHVLGGFNSHVLSFKMTARQFLSEGKKHYSDNDENITDSSVNLIMTVEINL